MIAVPGAEPTSATFGRCLGSDGRLRGVCRSRCYDVQRGRYRWLRAPATKIIRGALPLGLPYSLTRSPLRRLAPFGWLASLRSLAAYSRPSGSCRRSDLLARTSPPDLWVASPTGARSAKVGRFAALAHG